MYKLILCGTILHEWSPYPYYEKALEIRKKVLGEKNPDTVYSLNNIGGLLRAMGELKAARVVIGVCLWGAK